MIIFPQNSLKVNLRATLPTSFMRMRAIVIIKKPANTLAFLIAINERIIFSSAAGRYVLPFGTRLSA